MNYSRILRALTSLVSLRAWKRGFAMTSLFDHADSQDNWFDPCPFDVGDLVRFTMVGSDYKSIKRGDLREVLETYHNGHRWLLKLKNGYSPVGTSNYPAAAFALHMKKADREWFAQAAARILNTPKKETTLLHIAVKMQEGEGIGLAKEEMERTGFATRLQPGYAGRPILVDCSVSGLKAQIERASTTGFYWLIFSANTIGEPVAKVAYRSV